ncbi:hypothetical protein [Flagellimonas marinaquae]|uniref:hypothetical protein n=1 Tax=Flagellimonas marinaquae TaxID=254955 RepID=UPI0020765B93|nr:hypothetical protein [Allomuricauda aquimarina]USD24947.1 hypothetical protein MJO53_14820 [Allomuricauda aquimarina]
MNNFKKYFAEGLLIVFSVLFALLINKLFEDYKTNKKKTVAIESLRKELYRNSAILKNWKEQHIEIRNRINEVIEGRNDSLKTELMKYNYLNLGVLTKNESLIDAILTNTAWESAKSTGIIAEFDFETTQKLTYVYSMQDVLTNRTIAKIMDFYFDTNAHNMENIDQSLVQFQLRFWELTGQEELIGNLYTEAIKELKK